jgi:hypothetical protein
MLQVEVRNTFINVEEKFAYDDSDEILFRSTSEGHSPQRVRSDGEKLSSIIPEISLETCFEVPDHPPGDFSSDLFPPDRPESETSVTPDWLMPTPEVSPVHSPREIAALDPTLGGLLSAYLLSQNTQEAHCTQIQWPRCHTAPMMMEPHVDSGKCVPINLYMSDAAAVPPSSIQYGTCLPAAVNTLGGYSQQLDKHHDFEDEDYAPVQILKPQLPFGKLHRFHDETHSYGSLSEDCREFTKTKFGGRLSVITEDKVHTSGVHTYLVQFSKGVLSSADGLGFVFSPKLPCPKNIQRIVSIFVNSAGRICMRAQAQVMRSDVGVKPLELGDWITLVVDLHERVATVTVHPKNGGKASSAAFAFGEALMNARHLMPKLPSTVAGHFAFVVKNRGVAVKVSS